VARSAAGIAAILHGMVKFGAIQRDSARFGVRSRAGRNERGFGIPNDPEAPLASKCGGDIDTATTEAMRRTDSPHPQFTVL